MDALKIHHRPSLGAARMVLGFSGWMDGGETSTGAVEYLSRKLHARTLAEIDPQDFYLYSFPGPMEISALFRPHTRIEDGVITALDEPANTFAYSEEHRLILFQGKEPNLRWREYADCILRVVETFNVGLLWFVGSVAGSVPHTKDTPFFGSLSDERLRGEFLRRGIHGSSYEGPASFITYLTTLAGQKGIPMASLVAEIPVYVEGRNVKSIEAAARKLDEILGLHLDLSDLTTQRDEFEQRLDQFVAGRPELADLIRKLEENYDKEERFSRLDELKSWFEKQNIRLN